MQEQETRLQQEILQDAQRKAERTVERARKDAEHLVQTVRAEQGRLADAALAKARAEAEIRARSVLAGIRHDVHKLWLRRREAVLTEVFAEALRRVESGECLDRCRSLRERLAEAVAAMGGGALTIAAAAADAPLLDGAALAAAAAAAGLDAGVATTWQVTVDPTLAGGFVVSAADGQRRFDQTFVARLNRLRSALRQTVAAQVGAGGIDTAALEKECEPHE